MEPERERERDQREWVKDGGSRQTQKRPEAMGRRGDKEMQTVIKIFVLEEDPGRLEKPTVYRQA